MTDPNDAHYYKGKLRRVDLTAMLAEPADHRPVHCPDCRSTTTAGWCPKCGIDWCDGLADKLRAANPHVYGVGEGHANQS
jgi:hypothetical protein